ncbi:MAG: hypothetical protein IJU48_02665 [Synergistaceae bacterium]|nr:hypothetical protein [Synergistaceae bacterium]
MSKHKGGRRSKYNPEETPKLAEEYAKELLTDKLIAKKLGINIDTFYTWSKKYTEFSDAVKRGKEAANSDLVKHMYASAKGYDVEEEETTVILDANKQPTGFKKTTRKRHIPPSTTMQIFLAKNRMPEDFRDVNHQRIDVSGKLNVTTLADLMMEEYDSQEKN